MVLTLLAVQAVGECLVRLPRLLSLGSYPHTAAAVAHSVERRGGERQCETQLSLQYLHSQHATDELWSGVERFCPALHTIFLDTPDTAVMQVTD